MTLWVSKVEDTAKGKKNWGELIAQESLPEKAGLIKSFMLRECFTWVSITT